MDVRGSRSGEGTGTTTVYNTGNRQLEKASRSSLSGTFKVASVVQQTVTARRNSVSKEDKMLLITKMTPN
jgi:hypothetical protein